MTKNPNGNNENTPANQLRLEFDRYNGLFDIQLPIIQRFLEAQAVQIAEAYIERTQRVHFTLPDRVIAAKGAEPIIVAQSFREQHIGTFGDRLARRDVHETLRQRLTELEQSNEKAVEVAASLIRFAAATHMIHNMLPSGKVVAYSTVEEDDIPSIPISTGDEQEFSDHCAHGCHCRGRGYRKWPRKLAGPICTCSKTLLLTTMGGFWSRRGAIG